MCKRELLVILSILIFASCVSSKKYKAATSEAANAKASLDALQQRNNELQVQLSDAIASNKMLAEERVENQKANKQLAVLLQQSAESRTLYWGKYIRANQAPDSVAQGMFSLSKFFAMMEESENSKAQFDTAAIIDGLPAVKSSFKRINLNEASLAEIEAFTEPFKKSIAGDQQAIDALNSKYQQFLVSPTGRAEQELLLAVDALAASKDVKVKIQFTTAQPGAVVRFQQWRTNETSCSGSTNNCVAELLAGQVVFWSERNGKPTSGVHYQSFTSSGKFEIAEHE